MIENPCISSFATSKSNGATPRFESSHYTHYAKGLSWMLQIEKKFSLHLFYQDYQIKLFEFLKFYLKVYMFWFLKNYNNFRSLNEILKIRITWFDGLDKRDLKMTSSSPNYPILYVFKPLVLYLKIPQSKFKN